MKNPIYSLPVKTKRLVEIRKRKNEIRKQCSPRSYHGVPAEGLSGDFRKVRQLRIEFQRLFEEEKLLILRTVAGSPYSEPIYSIDDASMKRVMSNVPFGTSERGGFRLARTRK